MSYSRWGGRGSGHWYTFWLAGIEDEDQDTAVFDVCGVKSFSAKELREDLDACMQVVRELDKEGGKEGDKEGDIEELKVYALEFLEDISERYP